MKCEAMQAVLEAYVDGELAPAERAASEEHLHSCAACQARVAQRRALRALVADASPRFPAPPGLARAVRAHTAVRSWSFSALAATVAAFSVGGVLAATLTFAWVRPALVADAISDEIVSAHVRSLMTDNRLFDVASTDSHRVKPWFAGKLDFAPNVIDAADRGYPLLGGRLDYVGGRAVAALVYRHRLHTINLFVWPAGTHAAMTTDRRKGYHLVRWSRQGLAYWLISDLNPSDLQTFAQLLQEK